MNFAIFRRLLWKEFRQQWSFWVATALIILIILGLASVVESMFQQKADDFSYLGVVLALLTFYALGCGAMLFAGEHEAGTFEFQRNLPVTAFRVFLAKVAFAVVAMAALACVLSVAAILADQYRGHSLKRPVAWWEWCLMYGYILSLAFLWGMLFSLLIKRVLLATFLGAVVGLLCSGLGRVFVGHVIDDYFPKNVILFLFFLTDLSVLIIANIWLGRRWFSARPSYIRRAAARWGLLDSPLAALDDENMQTPRTSTILRRLTWQQWRFSRLMMGAIVLGCAAILLMFIWVLFSTSPHSTSHYYSAFGRTCLFISWCMVTLFGASVFLGDQRHHSVQFLAQRAARPRHVWFSRQIVWAAPLLLVFLGFLLYCIVSFGTTIATIWHAIPEQTSWYLVAWCFAIHFWHTILLQPAEWLAIIALIFAAGQLCSMIFRSGLLAMVFGLALSAVCAGWIAFMMLLGISPLWSVLPIAIGMFCATLLYTPNWMREHVGWRKYLQPAAAAVVPVLVILVAIPFYRVYSIPAVEPGFDVAEECNRIQTEAEIATVEMYRKAIRAMKPHPNANIYLGQPKFWDLKSSEKEWLGNWTSVSKTWVAENDKSIELALAASRRESCGTFDTQPTVPPTSTSTTNLGYLLVDEGNMLSNNGKLDLAAERYYGALRIASHLGKGINFRNGEIVEGRAYDGLRYWAATPGQTPDRIKAAIKEIDTITKTHSPLDEVIKDEYVMTRAIILNQGEPFSGVALSDYTYDWIAAFWYKLPWEKARLLRMLNRLTADGLEALKTISDPASVSEIKEPYVTSLASLLIGRSVNEGRSFFNRNNQISEISGRIAFYELNMRTVRRATKIVLALEAWKLEHGELPNSLGELVLQR